MTLHNNDGSSQAIQTVRVEDSRMARTKKQILSKRITASPPLQNPHDAYNAYADDANSLT
jgi:hypothetical protein